MLEFLAQFDHCEIVYFSDTALSGQKIHELGDPTIAAIASEEAARLFGLDVLKTGIANRDENFTRFVVVAAEPAEVPEAVPSKTSIVMAVGNHPGALMDALAVFHDADINLVMLESRPIANNPREELFYLDFDGNISEPAVQAVLETLMRQVRFLRVLGSYPSRDLRPKPVERKVKKVRPQGRSALTQVSPTASSPKGYKLGSRGHKEQNTIVEVSGVRIGGDDLVMIAGPCAVESWDQVMTAAKAVKESGGSILRGGCFKPRTSPYSFQGLAYEGSRCWSRPARRTAARGNRGGVARGRRRGGPQGGHPPDRHQEHAELLLALRCGRAHRPVMLKRGMSSSLDELLQAAEYILSEGNQQVFLCERGIRTFRDIDAKHARPECGARAAAADPPTRHRRSIPCCRGS